MSVLVLVAPGSEEIETVAIVDTLVRASIEVVLASCCPAGSRQVKASRGVQLVADCHIDELTRRDFEAIVVPGGLPGSEVIRDTPLAIDLLKEQAAGLADAMAAGVKVTFGSRDAVETAGSLFDRVETL